MFDPIMAQTELRNYTHTFCNLDEKVENATSTYCTIELQKGLRFNQACDTSC